MLSNDFFIAFAKTCLQKGSGTSATRHAKAVESANAKDCSGRVEKALAATARGEDAPGGRDEGTRQPFEHFSWQPAEKMQNLFPKHDCYDFGKLASFSVYRWLNLAVIIIIGATNLMGVKGCQKKSTTIRTPPHTLSAHNLVPLQTP